MKPLDASESIFTVAASPLALLPWHCEQCQHGKAGRYYNFFFFLNTVLLFSCTCAPVNFYVANCCTSIRSTPSLELLAVAPLATTVAALLLVHLKYLSSSHQYCRQPPETRKTNKQKNKTWDRGGFRGGVVDWLSPQWLALPLNVGGTEVVTFGSV